MDNSEVDLAKRLAGAYVSHALGLKSVDRTIKNYCENVSAFWVDLGKLITEHMREVANTNIEKTGGKNV